MDRKVLFIADYLRGGRNFSELRRMYEISRETGYKWISRFQDLGPDGLHEQSRLVCVMLPATYRRGCPEHAEGGYASLANLDETARHPSRCGAPFTKRTTEHASQGRP